MAAAFERRQLRPDVKMSNDPEKDADRNQCAGSDTRKREQHRKHEHEQIQREDGVNGDLQGREACLPSQAHFYERRECRDETDEHERRATNDHPPSDASRPPAGYPQKILEKKTASPGTKWQIRARPPWP